MTTVSKGPADTRMMGIVHDALRRDLGRAVSALSTAPYPEGAQRTAIGEHVAWMMGFLHAHHHGEDAGLWPLVRARDAREASLLDAMAADHARVAPRAETCETAADDYRNGSSDDTRVALLDALRHLGEVLLPHLRREEDEVLPLVSVLVTAAEWRAIDREYYLEPKSLVQLGFEGHWLLDGLDAERARIVVQQVPPVQRMILVHGFARRYRRHATTCWERTGNARRGFVRHAYGPAERLPRSIPRAGEVEVVVAAPIDAVWRVVSDVTRVGEWSHECRRVEWLDGATAAAVGVRFRGTNRAGPWTWSRVNEIMVADEPTTFVWRTVPTLVFPDSSEWRIELEPLESGTRIVQSFRVIRAPAVLARLYSIIVPSHRGRSTGLADDLRRLGQLAESNSSTKASALAK